MKRLLFILVFIYTTASFSQNALYKSDAFTIMPDKVLQGKFMAEAKSAKEINSNFISSYTKPSATKISFKFSIDGRDNENVTGTDHLYILTPVNGKDTTPVYVFGKPDPVNYSSYPSQYLNENTELLLKLDMRNVLSEIKEKGYYKCFDGSRITKKNFKGVYIAGGIPPLSWDFEKLPSLKNSKMEDPDGDGIYEIKLHFNTTYTPSEEFKTLWKLKSNISAYPSYSSPQRLVDALYNMSIEEMIADIREDGAFMAGIKWPGVWTRDVSYSIILSLAIVNPDASKASLMAKVKNGKIIEDTGTGGSWPVSSDRMVWALAAWEIYNVTGDKDWLKKCYCIIKKSSEDDMLTVQDKETGLFKGESSFLDWREQTYPDWMDPKDIHSSKNLGTNAVHYKTYLILAEMAKLLNEPSETYTAAAERIKEGINKYLWMEDKGYYSQFLYGRNFFTVSPKSEALGEALSVIYGVSDKEKSDRVISNTPVTKFGIPCVYPQRPGVPPYHNDAVWPFVEAYWAWAAAQTGNVKSAEKSIASIYRAAALFLTNKENFVSTTGDYLGTEINSDRQLWSVGGNLACVYRVFFGMSFNNDKIFFNPLVPEAYAGIRNLKNFKYRNCILNIEMAGFGDKIVSFKIDGKENSGCFVPGDLKGTHKLSIVLNNSVNNTSGINLKEDYFASAVPNVLFNDANLVWNPVAGAEKYNIYRNGEKLAETLDTVFHAAGEGYSLYQVSAEDKNTCESFLSEPVLSAPEQDVIVYQAENKNKKDTQYEGYTGDGYVFTEKNTGDISFSTEIPADGFYSIDFRYANGSGPVNTNNKCCIRSLFINNNRESAVIMPQRGEDSWTSWGFTNSILVNLKKGENIFTLRFTESDNNMNMDVNSAAVDYLRIIKVQ